jgi:hypothetical protein
LNQFEETKAKKRRDDPSQQRAPKKPAPALTEVDPERLRKAIQYLKDHPRAIGPLP